MNRATDFLVRRHIEYAKDHASEVRQYPSVYDHMYYYFTSRLGIAEEKAIAIIDDFRSDYVLTTALKQGQD